MPTTAYAAYIPVPEPDPIATTSIGLISHYSEFYGVSSTTVYKTLMCESGLKSDAVGDGGTSFGAAQIHLPAHKDVSKAQALDPSFAIPWTVKQFAAGNAKIWSCYRILSKSGEDMAVLPKSQTTD